MRRLKPGHTYTTGERYHVLSLYDSASKGLCIRARIYSMKDKQETGFLGIRTIPISEIRDAVEVIDDE